MLMVLGEIVTLTCAERETETKAMKHARSEALA
jgi:hypothetical protein